MNHSLAVFCGIKLLAVQSKNRCLIFSQMALSSYLSASTKETLPELHKRPLTDAQKSPASGGTKALSLLTGQLVTGYIKPPTKTSGPSPDLDMPVLQREGKLSTAESPRKEGTSVNTGLKTGVVKVVNVPCTNKRSRKPSKLCV
jgi:hypothetical protein